MLYTKRLFDISMAAVGLMIAVIPFCFISVLIKIDSLGPIIFKQIRVGRHGRPFLCFKFRTMFPDSEKDGTVTTGKDNRITSVGRFLRKYKLDEIPQFWNVLIGNMSFVGPRPDVPGYADRLQGNDSRFLELYPGITGPATLRFRDEEALLMRVADPQRYNDEIIYPEKIRLNLEYMDHWSFWKDIGYIIITVLPRFAQVVKLDRKLGLAEERG